jgi:dephospho-CoA kinase
MAHMIILLIGPKGVGKSTLREWLEMRNWKSVYVEALYDELDRAREHTVDNPSEDLRDLVYQTALDRILEFSRTENVVFDGTGSSERFDRFYKTLKKNNTPCYLVFVNADRELAYAHTQTRDIQAHRSFDRAYFDTIWNECHARKSQADIVIENNGSKMEFIETFARWFDDMGSGRWV